MNGFPRGLLRRSGVAAGALGGLSVVCAAGWVSLSLIDQIVMVGFAVVLPIVIGELRWWWASAVALVGLGFVVPRGWAALAVCPLVVASAAAVVHKLHSAGPLFWWDVRIAAEVLALVYGLVAALALLQSRSGVVVFDLHEPFVELTAVHYTFAGTGALYLAARCLDHRPASRLARRGVFLTAAAPPVVALGFVTGAALPQVGGAILMTLGVWTTATLQLFDARRSSARRYVAALLVISGLAIWVPMVLAVAWAAGQHWEIPILSVHDMARTHGVVNAFAFVICGLIARRVLVSDIAVLDEAAA